MRKSKLLTLIAHEVVPRKCVNNIEFVGYVARCSQCSEPIAIYYKFDDELRADKIFNTEIGFLLRYNSQINLDALTPDQFDQFVLMRIPGNR